MTCDFGPPPGGYPLTGEERTFRSDDLTGRCRPRADRGPVQATGGYGAV
jgi:hypothetical protein